ncbi:MAG: 16S rRNA (adenine(1518)-N(6)/adenine(1519)-N(6))-dimethyltransferase RsmA [Candidatus Omnitrophota bacterium]
MSLSKIAKKHLGQNFLTNPRIIDRIVNTADIRPDDTVLEIGPGLGALTKMIIPTGVMFFAIEKDPQMVVKLQESIPNNNLHLIQHDILTYDFSALPALTKIIGNIPYNISTQIVEKLIAVRHQCPRAFLTVQLDFAERLAAEPGNKDYGALTCFIQYYADVKILFNIAASAFKPRPKVTSAFISIQFREPMLKATDEKLLFQITRTVFNQRRKKMINPLSGLFRRELLENIFERLGIPKNIRGEDLELRKFVEIANLVNEKTTCSSLKTNDGSSHRDGSQKRN